MRLSSLAMFSAFVITASSTVMADESLKLVKLTGFQEVPPILTTGTGTFKWKLDHAGTSLSFVLTFSNLSSNATVAHIHFGQAGGTGAPIVFFCGGPKPACPADVNGTVSGTIMAADILDVPAQGVRGGNFDDFLAVLRSGQSYVNVHTTAHPSGEVRGQIKTHPWEGSK